ncbi:hypothetical protein BC826DRAFT_1108405 [Russula brevipes]|nr:hypothetical protein BC826DRAFT_1108405 [Russula brevipes]
MRSAAPQTFAVELGIVPQAAGAQVRRLRASSLPGPASDHRLHRATIRNSLAPQSALLAPPLCNANGGEHHAASATRNGGEHRAASATCNGGEHRTASATRNGGEHHAASATRNGGEHRVASATCNGGEHRTASAMRNGGEHRAATATRTAASIALAAQREGRQAARWQRNVNGSEYCTGRATGASRGMGRASGDLGVGTLG